MAVWTSFGWQDEGGFLVFEIDRRIIFKQNYWFVSSGEFQHFIISQHTCEGLPRHYKFKSNQNVCYICKSTYIETESLTHMPSGRWKMIDLIKCIKNWNDSKSLKYVSNFFSQIYWFCLFLKLLRNWIQYFSVVSPIVTLHS